MSSVCDIKSMVAIRITAQEADGTELAQFVLNGRKPDPAASRQLADVLLVFGFAEQQSQDLGPDSGKQNIQNRRLLFHKA